MVITINKPELGRLIGLCWKQKPELEDLRIVCTEDGWATVDVPNWEGTRPELYSLAQGRIYGPESYPNKVKEAT